jgi:hypothetical protein
VSQRLFSSVYQIFHVVHLVVVLLLVVTLVVLLAVPGSFQI